MTGQHAEFPNLTGDALAAANYRDGHLQIIASAGSGKTEIVSQRVANLLAEGSPPESIVAFTFTERAAASLKSRIEKRVAALSGEEVLNRLGGMFVGTIHSYCFRVLQQHVPRYETFDVLDDHRLASFLVRISNRIGIKRLEGTMFKSIRAFLGSLDVVENELVRTDDLEDPFREIYESYLTQLENHRFLSYGQIIARAVEALHQPDVFEDVHGPLRHLIVDEYQDVNPAQEALVQRLAEPPVHLCVVGDDDQSIYQWRGADVTNIVTFADRYPEVRRFTIEMNRRSRPGIIEAANAFGESIEGRLPKRMREHREAAGPEVLCWSAETESDQAAVIARAAKSAHDDHGYPYRDIAILCRSRTSLPDILEALDVENVPVQPGGRTNLFLQEDADLFGRTIAWLADDEWWPEGHQLYNWDTEPVDLEELLSRYRDGFDLDRRALGVLKAHLLDWKARVSDESTPANLVRDFYEVLRLVGVEHWDLEDALTVNRLGTLARCSQLLADYESTKRRARPDLQEPGLMVGGSDRGTWYYRMLSIFIKNWASGAYEDFEGEDDITLDAVDLTTVHQAKGLEWPIVFVPSLTNLRFPSKGGRPRTWYIPTDLFDPERYNGTLNDERRLFYVAMTRARDYLSLSTFERITRVTRPSIFLEEVANGDLPLLDRLPAPPPPEIDAEDQEIVEITFSDLAAYLECGLSFRLRRSIGFQPPLASEIGYGRAVHHVLRRVADFYKVHRRKPTPKQLERLFDDDFYLPAANKAAYREMRKRAKALVDRYLEDWDSDLGRIWQVERPFELHLGEVTVSGRADVILDEANGGPPRLSIVDYKTAADAHGSHAFQLQVYTDAGRREGLVVDGAFVHDLKAAERHAVPVAEEHIAEAETQARSVVARMKERLYEAKPVGEKCNRCDVKPLCRYRAE